jgi:hypothetical protein
VFYNSASVRWRARRLTLTGIQIGLPLGFTGVVARFLTGSSRAPAVSAIVPALLTFIGIMVVYMIGKGALRSIIVSFAVFVFSADLLIGSVLGSASGDRHDEILASGLSWCIIPVQQYSVVYDRLIRANLTLGPPFLHRAVPSSRRHRPPGITPKD